MLIDIKQVALIKAKADLEYIFQQIESPVHVTIQGQELLLEFALSEPEELTLNLDQSIDLIEELKQKYATEETYHA